MDALRRSFAAAALAWAALLPLATFAASRTHLGGVSAAFTLVVYAVGAVVCHQLPGRSFHVWGAQMPVCARCTGIYFGAAAAAAIIALARLKPRPTQVARGFSRAEGVARGFSRAEGVARGFSRAEGVARGFSRATPQSIAVLAIAPAAATLVFEWTTGLTPSNAVRCASGLWLGGVLTLLVLAAMTPSKREVN